MIFPFLIIRILFACRVVYCMGGDCEVRNPVSVCVRVCLSCEFFVGAMLFVCVLQCGVLRQRKRGGALT